MKRILLIILIFGVGLVACQAPQVTSISEDDKAAITESEKSYMESMKNRDEAGLRAVMTEDAITMPPNGNAKVGIEAIISSLGDGPPLKELTTAYDEVEGIGDIAYSRGTYSVVVAINDSTDFADEGKFIEVWRKQDDGSWKIARDIWNSNESPPAEEEEVEMVEE